MIHDNGRQYIRTAEQEILQLARKCGGGALGCQLQQDFHQNDADCLQRPHGKAADDFYQTCQIKIHEGGQEGKREINMQQDAADGTHHGNHG